jgi:hypothetical protein
MQKPLAERKHRLQRLLDPRPEQSVARGLHSQRYAACTLPARPLCAGMPRHRAKTKRPDHALPKPDGLN